MLQLKPVKFSADEQLLFWSDLHMRHSKLFIINPRGFDLVEKHDEELIGRLSERSRPETTLFLLGDTVFGMEAYDYWLDFLSKFAAKTVYIMPGNHFAGLQELIDRRGEHFYWADKEIKIIPNYFEIEVGGKFIVLGHYPLASWNKMNNGAYHGHGHCHSNLIKTDIGDILYKKRIIDVGVDNCPYPLNFQEFCEKASEGEAPKN